MRSRWRSLAVAGGVLVGVAGCASLQAPPEDLQVGEGRLIHAEWTVDEPQFDAARVSGYVVNTYYYFAARVPLLVEAFDAQGRLVDQRVQWVAGGVPPGDRIYFEVRNLPPADAYRVTVPYYTWQDRPDGVFGTRF